MPSKEPCSCLTVASSSVNVAFPRGGKGHRPKTARGCLLYCHFKKITKGHFIVSLALLSISSLYGFTISILQIRWRTLWMVQTDAYRSPEVGSVVFYPLELVGHFAVRGSQIGESWFFWLYFRNFKITPKLSLEGPFYLTHVCREWNGLSNGILEYIVKIIDDNGRFLKKIEKNRAESQNRHFFRKLWPCGYTHWLSQKAK